MIRPAGIEGPQSNAFESAIEWRLWGTRQMIEAVAVATVQEVDLASYQFSAHAGKWRGQEVIRVQVELLGPGQVGLVGFVSILEAPGGVVWLRVPPYRGDRDVRTYPMDPEGRLFAHYLNTLRAEVERLGYTSPSSRLKARSIFDNAYQQLAAAEGAAAYAGIGNLCRSALIALADEVFEGYMLPEGVAEPRGDDVDDKLKYCIRHYLAGSSNRYRAGLEGVVRGTWGAAVALSHRKHATREEAEICVDQASTLADGIAKLALKNQPHD